MLNREVGFDREEIGDGVALLIGELTAEAIWVEDSLALRLGHLAEVAEGASDHAASILGKPTILFYRAVPLLPLCWSEVLDLLVALKEAPALLRCHVVELSDAIVHALLCLQWKIAETRFVFKRALLVCRGKVAVTSHPLRQVLLIPLRTILLRLLSRTRRVHGRPWRLTHFVHRRRLSHNHRRCCRQKHSGEGWVKDTPRVELKCHGVQPGEAPGRYL
jgi:hypothetical protein